MPTTACVLAGLLLSSAALAEAPMAPTRVLALAPAAVSFDDAVAASADARDESASSKPAQRYLDAGTSWWTFGFGGSAANNSVRDANATVAYTYFVDDRVEFTLELGVRAIVQDGDDAVGFNPAMVFRYHFWESEDRDWTAFADIGIGIMGSTSDVPEDGTSLNFTPRAGVGFTRRLSDDWRLQVGVRWSHISNGRIFGNDDNPASDGVAVGIGFITSF